MAKKLIIWLLILGLSLAYMPGESLARLSGQSRSMVGGYDINGYTISSFYPQGAWYRKEVDVLLDKKKAGKADLESFLSVRVTNDEYVDDQTSSIERMYVKFTEETKGLELGDFYARFSPYVLNQSLKGITAYSDFDLIKGSKVTGLFGTTKDEWEELYRETNDEIYTRYVGGFRIEQVFDEYITWAVSFVKTEDDEKGTKPSTSSAVAIDSKMLSFDSQMKFFDGKFSINSEIAQSWYKSNIRSGAKRRDDAAFKVKTAIKIGALNWNNNYERVGTNFAAPVGTASTDREEFKTKLKYKPNRSFEAKTGYTVFHDNLNNQKTTTSVTSVPFIEFAVKPFESRKYLNLDLSYKVRKIETGNGSTTDQATRTFYTRLKDKIFGYDINLGYKHRRKDDDVTVTNERDIHFFIAGAKTRFNVFKIRVSPSVQWQVEKDKQITTKGMDTYQTTSLKLNFYFPKGGFLNLKYNILDTNKDPRGSDVVKTVAASELRAYLFGDRNKELKLKYELRDFNKENNKRSYAENLFEAKFTYKF